MVVLTAYGTVLALRAVLPAWSLNHDVAWYLAAAARLIDGEELAVDILDVNPPGILYLSTIPVAVARATAVPIEIVARASVLTFAGLALWIARPWLTARLPRIDSLQGLTARAWGLWLVTWFAEGDFGQREHLLAIGSLPFVLCAGSRCSGSERSRAFIAGLLCSIVVCLKPWFVLVPLLALGRNLRRAEALGCASGLATLAMTPLFWSPDVRAAYADGVARTWSMYSALNASPSQVFAGPEALRALLVVALAWAGSVAFGRVGVRLAVIASAMLTAAWAQSKGWTYHYLPATAFAGLSIVVTAANWRRIPRWVAVTSGVTLVVLTGLGLARQAIAWDSRGLPRIEHRFGSRQLAIDTLTSTGARSALWIDTSVSPAYPVLLHSRLRSVWSLPCAWPLATQSPAALHDVLQTIERALADHPDVVLVRRGHAPFIPTEGRELIDWLQSTPTFRQAIDNAFQATEDLRVDGIPYAVWRKRRDG